LNEYKSLDNFIRKWNEADKKLTIMQELQEQGILLYDLQELVGRDLDPFDLIAHVAFDQPALTRKERAMNVKKRNYFAKYGEQAQLVLKALLDKYADKGIENIESARVLELAPINDFGTPAEIVKLFGGPTQFRNAVKELESELYSRA
jgi:type I restriction enzyme R subunit